MSQETPCEGKRKHYSPHRCRFVPVDHVKTFFMRYPKLSHYVFWDCFMNWYIEGWREFQKHRYYRNAVAIDRKWQRNFICKKFTEIIQRELRYEKTTLAAGHIITRFGRIYRRLNGYSWNQFGDEVTFSKNGEVIYSEKWTKKS